MKEQFKTLLVAEIERDLAELKELNASVSLLNTRLKAAKRMLYISFPEEVGRLFAKPVVSSRIKRHSHALAAARAITIEGNVGKPLSPADIHKAMIRTKKGTYERPDRPTLISSLVRSPMFESPGRALYVLTAAVEVEEGRDG